MIKPAAPMSNAQRQAKFRAANPGYYSGRRYIPSKSELAAAMARAAAKAPAAPVTPAEPVAPTPQADAPPAMHLASA
jgi:hypothetical protein